MSNGDYLPPPSGYGNHNQPPSPPPNPANGYGYPQSDQYGSYPYPPQSQPYYSQKSKIAAGLFGIFLGAFGVQNFYLGYTGKGVAQLLITILSFGIFSWVSAIWGIIEGILVLSAQPGSPWSYDAHGIPLSQ